MKLFEIQDWTHDDGSIVLFCKKGEQEFEIKFSQEKFEQFLHDTDRMLSEVAQFNDTDYTTVDKMISIEEYYGNADAHIKQDLYEYLILRLVTPEKMFDRVETALSEILNTQSLIKQ